MAADRSAAYEWPAELSVLMSQLWYDATQMERVK